MLLYRLCIASWFRWKPSNWKCVITVEYQSTEGLLWGSAKGTHPRGRPFDRTGQCRRPCSGEKGRSLPSVGWCPCGHQHVWYITDRPHARHARLTACQRAGGLLALSTRTRLAKTNVSCEFRASAEIIFTNSKLKLIPISFQAFNEESRLHRVEIGWSFWKVKF